MLGRSRAFSNPSFVQVTNPHKGTNGLKRELFFLNVEDGYFGCKVNESVDVLKVFELSKLCDGAPQCFLGSDELHEDLKCTGKFEWRRV